MNETVEVRVELSTGEVVVRREMVTVRTCTLHFGNAVRLESREMQRFANLGTLWLECNQLVSVPDELCLITSLATLGLHENALERLPETIGQLKMLSWLSVRQNRLTALPESIADCVRLKTLYLKDNDLCILPLRMAELSLGQLSLANNPRLDLDCVGSHPLVSSLDTLVTANNGRAWWRRVGRAQVLCIASALQSLELPTLVLLAITDQYDVSQQQVTMFLKWSAISLVRHFLEKQRANQESHQEAKVD